MVRKGFNLISVLSIAFIFMAVSLFVFVKDASAYAQWYPKMSDNHAVIVETYSSDRTSSISVESYGNTNASLFYLYSPSVGSTVNTESSSLRDYKYNISLSGLRNYSDVSRLLGFENNFVNSEDDTTLKNFDFVTLDDKFICHDNHGVYYLLNCIEERQLNNFPGAETDNPTRISYSYELIPIAEKCDVEFASVKFKDNAFDNLSSTSGDLYLNPDNDYTYLLSKATQTIRPNAVKTASNYTVNGDIIPYDDMNKGLFLLWEPQYSVGNFEFRYELSDMQRKLGSGKVFYRFTPKIDMDVDTYVLYQDSDVGGTYNYTVFCASPYNGSVKITYKDKNGSVVSTKRETITNGQFNLTMPSGQFAYIPLPSYETFLNGYKLNQVDDETSSFYWGYTNALAGYGQGVVLPGSQLHDVYTNYVNSNSKNYHDWLAYLIKNNMGGMKVDCTMGPWYSSEWGECSSMCVYNAERDGKLSIDSVNDIGKTVSITGNIELSDKTININSNNFQITNGVGTFSTNNSKIISLTKVPRLTTYKISNVKTADGTAVESVTPSEGAINQGTTVKITLAGGNVTPPAENVTVTFKSNDGTNSTVTQTMEKGVLTPLRANSFTRSGYTFKGWSYSAGGSVYYNDKESVTLSNNITLYAVWEQNSSDSQYVQVTYHSNDGKDSTYTQVIKKSVQTNLIANKFTRSGYTFQGWSRNASSTSATYSDGVKVSFSTNVDLYAIWKSDGSGSGSGGGETQYYDSSLKIESMSGLSPISQITGNIELGDKTVSLHSNNFNITNGVGTFTLVSNGSITIQQLLRGQTFKLSNVKTNSSQIVVDSVSSLSGTLGSGITTIKVNLKDTTSGGSGSGSGETQYYDGSVKFDCINNLDVVCNVVGNIEFSDSKLNYKSTYFNITNGKGTFTIPSNKAVTLNSLLRGQTFKVSNVKTNNSNVSVSSASPASGTVKTTTTTIKVVLKKASSTTTPTVKTGQTVWAKVLPVKAGQLKVSWSKVSGADYYLVYGSKTGKSMKKLAKVTGTSYTHKKLSKTAGYQYRVVAYHKAGNIKVGTSRVVKAIASKYNKKYSNVKSMKLNVSGTITLKKGSTKKLKVTQTRYNKKKSYYLKGKVDYMWDDSSVISISNGVIKAKKAGKTTVDVVTVNGLHKRITVIVK